MHCLILAAGCGARLRSRAESKPLLPVLGVPLLERCLRAAREAGAEEFTVVTGHRAAEVEAFARDLGRRLGVEVAAVRNPAYAEAGNGRSVLAAEQRLRGRSFLLVMADHLFEPELVRAVLAAPPPAGGVVLAVDGQLDNPLVDPDDVTRVRLEGPRIRAIGKGLEPYDGYDTGVFHAGPALFEALRAAAAAGDTSLSGGVGRLAAQGRAAAVRVAGRFWIDVDDERQLARAERALCRRLAAKATDGPVARRLNRPLSIRITRLLAGSSVTPNQLSLAAFALSVAAALLFCLGNWPALAAGGLLAQCASILDGSDGELARLTYRCSDYGRWMDAVLDRYADALLLSGLTLHALGENPAPWIAALGLVAVTGSFVLSYTADKYDGLMRRRLEAGAGPGLRLGRDLRVLIVALGALLHAPLASLAVTAVSMNAEAVRRLFALRGAVEAGA